MPDPLNHFSVLILTRGTASTPGKDTGVYRTHEEARADVFDYIEIFYNRKRRHGYPGNISPIEFEQKTTGLHETVL